MNKTVLLVLTIAITSVTGGCSYFSDFNEARKEVEESAKKPIPVRVNTAKTPDKTTEEEDEEFADLETEAEAEATQAIAGLVPATDPDTRVRKSVRGRPDPFSVVTLVPKIEIEEVEEEPQPVNNRNNRTNRERNRVSQRPNSNNNNNRNNRPPNPVEELRAELAQEVIISGLYESNGRTKLIVNAPEEDNSRYVEVGQYLSNGQILVKSIDRNHFPTPLVVLEQSGVEVFKAIGETPEDSRSQASLLPTERSDDRSLLSNISLNLEDVR